MPAPHASGRTAADMQLRALYVTERFDGPYRYRCQQACEQLRRAGAIANVHSIDDPALPLAIRRYGVLVLFRLPWSPRVAEVFDLARRAGLRVLFDIDDLTFDPTLDELMPFRRRYSAEEWARSYGRQMIGLRRTFDACDAFIGSTRELAEHAERLGKQAFVHPNVVPDHYLKLGRWLEPASEVLRKRLTIGYFSGSDTHDEDFSSIAGALELALRQHPEARLLVVGYLAIEGRRTFLRGRLVRLPYMHWKDFAVAYAACRVTLAPLAVDNAFTRAKSCLKFFEAGAFGTPVIATPVREMEAAIVDGQNGFLARTEGEWVRAIDLALTTEVGREVGRLARDEVVRHHSAEAQFGRLARILEHFAGAPAGRAPRPSPLDPPNETGRRRLVDRVARPAKALRDAVRIARAAHRAAGPDLDVLGVEAAIERALSDPKAREALERSGALVYTSADLDRFEQNGQIVAEGALPGESRSTGSDPQLWSPSLDLDPRRYRYLALRLRAACVPLRTSAQIFWKGDRPRAFSEKSRATFAVNGDGLDTTYLVDLEGPEFGGQWKRSRKITGLRIDPLDRPGSFRIGAIALVPLAAFGNAELVERRPPPELELEPSDERAGEKLARAWTSAKGRQSLSVLVQADPERARLSLIRWISGHDFTVLDVRAEGTASTSVTLSRASGVRRAVDVVVPVFNARKSTLRCLTSVIRHARGDYRLVVIDDKSTDPDLAPALDRFARAHRNVVLLTNEVNLGFAGAANRGLAHAGDRDVLLLNSDTEVFEGFLERLRAAAYCRPRIGLVSPLSNNATICSVPEFCKKNVLPPKTTGADVATLVARSSLKIRPELVTPHGFCLFLRADCLAEVGTFDLTHFGRGFGEENDLGERAHALGWKTVLADDVYVWHEGKASFGDEGFALEKVHAEVLEKRHPGYHASVARFVGENPLARIQETVRHHLARRSHRVEAAALLLLHASPFSEVRGGVEHSVRDLVLGLGLQRVVIAYPTPDALEAAEIIDGNLRTPFVHRFAYGYPPGRFCHEHPEGLRAVGEILDVFRIGWVHIHHLMFLPLSIPRLLLARGLPYALTVHDFYPICPSYNLLELGPMAPCCPASRSDPARTAACQRALCAALGEPAPSNPVGFVEEHRRRFQEIFDGAVLAMFPSPSALRITSEILRIDEERSRIVPHGYRAPSGLTKLQHAAGALRVAIVGQVAYPTKGAAAYVETIEQCGGSEVEWHVFGRADLFGFDRRIRAIEPRPRVVFHGPYDREQIVTALVEQRVDLALLLPAWPETFSYTLSEILAAGVPVIARRIGALADRLDGVEYAILLDDPGTAAREILRLARNRTALREMASRVPASTGMDECLRAHRELYAECKRRSPLEGTCVITEEQCQRLEQTRAAAASATALASTTTRPAPEIAKAWWFPLAELAKPHAPESLRQMVRRRLSKDRSRTVLRYSIPGRFARLGQELTLERRYVGTAKLVAHGADPRVELVVRRLDPRKVDLVRFNLWCSTPHDAFAQLYWRHEGDPAFDEQNSLTIPLDGRSGVWQEYVARFDSSATAQTWYEGGPIVALRFDPIDLPGAFMLGELCLCEARLEPLTLRTNRG